MTGSDDDVLIIGSGFGGSVAALLAAEKGYRRRARVAHPGRGEFVGRLAEKRGSRKGALLFEIINCGASAHFVGGIPIGEASDSGAVDPFLRVFGQPGLHVMDGSVIPANPGVNPSPTITALVERAMSLWPSNRDAETGPPLGSGLRAHQSGHAVPACRILLAHRP